MICGRKDMFFILVFHSLCLAQTVFLVKSVVLLRRLSLLKKIRTYWSMIILWKCFARQKRARRMYSVLLFLFFMYSLIGLHGFSHFTYTLYFRTHLVQHTFCINKFLGNHSWRNLYHSFWHHPHRIFKCLSFITKPYSYHFPLVSELVSQACDFCTCKHICHFYNYCVLLQCLLCKKNYKQKWS